MVLFLIIINYIILINHLYFLIFNLLMSYLNHYNKFLIYMINYLLFKKYFLIIMY